MFVLDGTRAFATCWKAAVLSATCWKAAVLSATCWKAAVLSATCWKEAVLFATCWKQLFYLLDAGIHLCAYLLDEHLAGIWAYCYIL
jgi:hypothetical protein